MHKHLKRALGAGMIGGAAYAAWRVWSARVPQRPRGVEWSTAPFPFPPVPHSTTTPPRAASATSAPPVAESAPPPTAAWVEPDADGNCPPTHPVKAKLSSGIFHVPGGANYARTKPDRCYTDAAAAEADGLRPSKV